MRGKRGESVKERKIFEKRKRGESVKERKTFDKMLAKIRDQRELVQEIIKQPPSNVPMRKWSSDFFH